jgi:hypothetical protein
MRQGASIAPLGKARFDGWSEGGEGEGEGERLRRVQVSHSEASWCRTHDIKVK